MSDAPRLTVVAGADAGRQFPLTIATITVGRHSGNVVPLQDDQVSRRHLELRRTAAGYEVADLGSGNGTTLNGEAVKVAPLKSGDQIALGGTTLRYDEVAARATSPPSRFGDSPSTILRTVAEDEGSRILSRPEDGSSDWLRSRLASLTVLYEAAEATAALLDVEELLGRVVELVRRTTEADHGCAVVRDPESGDLAVRGRRSREGETSELVVSRTVIDHVLSRREGVLVADAGADSRFAGGASVVRHRLREVICVPLKGRHGTVGVLFLSRAAPEGDAGRFRDDHLRLAAAVAHQAALAVEETRYYEAMVQGERLAAVGQAVATLSHHIKNVMQGVRFGSDMVRAGLADGDDKLVRQGWRLVEKNQAKIDAVMLDMLSFSKEREPQWERADLNAVAADALEVVRGRAAGAGVELLWEPDADLPECVCDPEGLHRALLNVVSNAVDAAASDDATEPREVRVTSRRGAGFAEIAVADTGPGIGPEALAAIFQPFVSTKGARGTGLGLPVSRKVLREHGGDVLVSSTPGAGSVFTLRLPLRTAAPGALSEPEA